MRTLACPLVIVAVFTTLAAPLALTAQNEPPSGLAKVELARSRDCVRPLTRLEALGDTLQPAVTRMDRLDSVANAVAIEDTSIVSSLKESDSVEARVRTWFRTDQALARRIVESNSDSLRSVRQARRDSIKALLRRTMAGVQAVARAKADSLHADSIQAAAAPCSGMIFVRSAVRQACRGLSGTLCRLAAADSSKPDDPFQFVATPKDLWGIQQFLPWTDPAPVQPLPGGGLGGAQTQVSSRQGNVLITVAVQPLLQSKAQVDSTRTVEDRALLDSLGITFDVPQFVMTPSIILDENLAEPIGGETDYILHFGALGKADILWSGAAGRGKPMRVLMPLTLAILKKLEAGTPLNFSAVKIPKEKGAKAIPVFTIQLIQVNEAQAVSTLADYMTKQLGEDLKKLVGAQNKSG